ncbi:MAG: hypothetical protein F6K58_20005 [Symploca sp. SIO2E9]|nr:hypothetical protein [Symploca sp. SIO2E9]
MLEQLLAELRCQVEDSQSISFNNQIPLPSEELERISQVFLLEEDQHLTVSNIDEIPDPDGNKIKISGGKTELWQQSDIDTQVIFEVDDNVVKCQIALKMNEDWSFKNSFANLTDIFPFNDNVIGFSESYFIYSSQAELEYSPWSNHDDETISLEPGLNFASWLTLNDILSEATNWLSDVIGINTPHKCWGGVAPNRENPYPVMKLALPLTEVNLDIVDGKLSLGQPGFVIEITEPIDLIQEIDLRLVASTEDLEFGVSISKYSPGLTFNVESIADGFSADKILQLPGGEGFQEYIPAELNDAFGACVLKEFSIVVAQSKRISFISLSIGTSEGKQWELIPDVITLDNIALRIESLISLGDRFTTVSLEASCKLFPNIFPDQFNFELELDNGGDKWAIDTIRGSYYGSVELNALVQEIIGSSETVPNELGSIIFSEFGVNVTKNGSYSYSLYGRCEAIFPLLDTQLISVLSIVYNYSTNNKEMSLQGAFLVGQENFRLDLTLSNTSSSVMQASWEAIDEQYLKIEDIAKAFGFAEDEIPPIPEDLDLSLKSASLDYNYTEKILAIALQSANYGKAVFVAIANTGQPKKFLFGLIIDTVIIRLSDLPLVGEQLTGAIDVGLKDFQVIVASQTFKEQDVSELNSQLEGITLPSSSKQEIVKGASIGASLSVGETYEQTLFLPLKTERKGEDARASLGNGTQPERIGTTYNNGTGSGGISIADNGVWLEIQRSFGPLEIKRVGLQYRNSEIHFVPEIALTSSTFTFFLNQVSISTPLSNFEPKFNLNGFELEYKNAAMEIGGAFLRYEREGYTEYAGMAVMKLSLKAKGGKPPKTLGLSAIGAYAYYQDQPSFFLYAVLDFPLGGPPFFFVTGLAAGFGYNRKLKVPPLGQMEEFPLVAQAIEGESNMDTSKVGEQVSSQLQLLQDYIPITQGAGFLAIGVKFTSFKVLDCFALLTVAIEESLEVNLLGVATLIAPPQVGKKPIAKITMYIKATLSLEEGELSIAAEIQEDDSYIIFPDSTLTGSAAIYIGFAGEHEGDFVITAGGYHPDFEVPSHYPQVKSRLGFNANVGPLSITGERYFALCPHAVMAGGRLEASYRSGKAKASFTVYADFLISWKPFYYSIRAGVRIEASYGSLGPVSASVSLRIWGPDFGGYAEIKVVVVKVKIKFGDQSSQNANVIEWEDFKKSFLPADEEVCNIAVSEGLVKHIKNDTEDILIVNPKEFELVTNSTIPINKVIKGEGPEQIEDNGFNTEFGIRPMALKGKDLTSTHKIKITRKGTDENSTDTDVTKEFQFNPITKNVPSGLWSEPDENQLENPIVNTPKVNADKFVDNTLSGFRIEPANQPPAGNTEHIEVSQLQYDVETVGTYAWNYIVPFTGTSSDDGRQKIRETVEDNSDRNQILAALGFNPSDDIDIRESIADDFVIPPQVN